MSGKNKNDLGARKRTCKLNRNPQGEMQILVWRSNFTPVGTESTRRGVLTASALAELSELNRPDRCSFCLELPCRHWGPLKNASGFQEGLSSLIYVLSKKWGKWCTKASLHPTCSVSLSASAYINSKGTPIPLCFVPLLVFHYMLPCFLSLIRIKFL